MAIVACGGGGGTGADAVSAASNVTATSAARPSTAASAGPSSVDPAAATPNSSATANVKALGASASVALEGILEQPVAAAPVAGTNTNYYVDSNTGSDANDGLSATTGTGSQGPWRSLGRVLQSPLTAGDGLVLDCGSVWNETLRLPVSGTSAKPIIVRAAQPNCQAPPVIDGSISLPPSAWSAHQGRVYRAALSDVPLQVTAGTSTVWTEAHHPNRGYLPSDPGSPYLSTAADSDTIAVNGAPASNSLLTGSDLSLPAGVQVTAGTRVGIRIYGWWYEDHTVTAYSGNRLSFDGATLFPVTAGRGYYLKGQLWMVDSEGEWYHDASAGQIYAYMPDGTLPTVPVLATVLATGVDLQGRDNVVIDGLVIRRTGVGADLRGARNVTVRNSSVTDTSSVGVDATGTAGVTIESCAFLRTGSDAVSGWRSGYTMNSAMTARNNVIRDSGVIMSGETILSQPTLSAAAIYTGPGSVVSGNVIVNAGYIGILAQAGSLIENNFVYGACTVLDDCGGIFTQYANNNNIIRGNTVVRTRGARAGKPASEAALQAQGIYLDEGVTGTLVENNTVIDAENGILVHVSQNNTIRRNRLYANRASQIWLQADVMATNPTRDVVNNRVTDNLIAPIFPTSVGIKLETNLSSTVSFGTVDGNRYYDRATPIAVAQSTSAGTALFSFAGWQQAASSTLPVGRDAKGSAISKAPYTSFRVTGSNLIPYSDFANNGFGWNPWNAEGAPGVISSSTCSPGACLRYVAGGSPGQISSPNFGVVKGKWYRLSFDVAASSDGLAMGAIVRRGGGGNNGYDPVSTTSRTFAANKTWSRYDWVFQSTVTINAHDLVTLDNGARLDFSPIPVGETLLLANVELVAITPDAIAALSGALVNAAGSSRGIACPFEASQPSLCGKFRNLADDSAVSWPVTVAANSAALIYAQEPTLLDSDGDGIADVDDLCPGTPAGTTVNAGGCPLTLR
jgi:parallel beta-helix repeat protein